VKTITVESAERGRSPLAARIRFLMDGPHGNMIHSTVPPGMVGCACHFRTIDEYWYVLSGEGEIWRSAPDGHESITQLIEGVCIDIPLGTHFQYRCTEACPLSSLHGPAAVAGRRRGRDRRRALGYPMWIRSPGTSARNRPPARPAAPDCSGNIPELNVIVGGCRPLLG
jgi:mannose-6-phosphate isomerase-like protein (cupin superfamily)